jgi:hypothetical protein
MNRKTMLQLMEKPGIHLCADYGEPGYHSPDNGVMLGNWNDVPQYIKNGLERRGFSLEWYDGWTINHDTNKAYRTTPSHYGWKPYFIQNDWTNGEIIGGDEIENNEDLQAAYIEEYLLNNERAASLFNINLEKRGFTKVKPHFESGLHEGQNDDPSAIAEQYKDVDFVLTIDELGQFDTRFSIWTRE